MEILLLGIVDKRYTSFLSILKKSIELDNLAFRVNEINDVQMMLQLGVNSIPALLYNDEVYYLSNGKILGSGGVNYEISEFLNHLHKNKRLNTDINHDES